MFEPWVVVKAQHKWEVDKRDAGNTILNTWSKIVSAILSACDERIAVSLLT